MGGYINKSGNYRFEELGIVHINVRSTARTVRARWKGGAIVVSAPTGIPYDDMLKILRGWASHLAEVKPENPYRPDQEYDFGDFRIKILSQTYSPNEIISNFDCMTGTIAVGANWDYSKPETIKTISKFMCRIAQYVAPVILMPLAEQVASRVGRKPMRWTISHGHRLLGHCSQKGEIALSYVLVFYPPHLRDYVICHELAHLTEMNHSVRFHEVCNQYCGGRERELEAEIRAYKLPIIR